MVADDREMKSCRSVFRKVICLSPDVLMLCSASRQSCISISAIIDLCSWKSRSFRFLDILVNEKRLSFFLMMRQVLDHKITWAFCHMASMVLEYILFYLIN